MTSGELGDLQGPLRQFLPRQRWYAGAAEPSSVTVFHEERMKDGPPVLVDTLIEADGAVYQVPIGLRRVDDRPDFLGGRDDGVIGEVAGSDGSWLAYDAVLDPDLDLALLDVVTSSGESAERVRPVGGEQSNSSLVYDDRVILKVFRRLHPGPNLDIEVTKAISGAGFDHVAPPLATLTRTAGGQRFDLAVLQPFLGGGVDGWALALTSLRDLFGVGDTQSVPMITADMLEPPKPVDPRQAGGDFGAEARRLGTITAEMHRALADAFGRETGDGTAWADIIEAQVEALQYPGFERGAARRILEALREVDDVGPAIRVHGDYHLGQVLRTDAGWFVLDFEGEPERPPAERRQRWSALRDVAGMLRSLHYASAVALWERDEECAGLAGAWEQRNRMAFLEGYLAVAKANDLLPDEAGTEAVLAAFELEKAVYELGYEQGHRPDWAGIPLQALQRLGVS
ncbi:MAG: maltokinase N-terminal cap-like domain-containing protein [Acidimicrobiales bacterium]